MVDKQSWTIIIFAYNEETAVAGVIKNTINLLQKIAPQQYEIIIVDDGSTDNTLSVIAETIKNHEQIRLVSHEKNMGIGNALRSGYALAKNENICAIPADGQFDIDEIIPYAFIPHNNIVSFYRVEKTKYNFYRKLLSFANRSINYYLLGIKIKDVNWVKIYKKEFFDNNNLKLTSSLVESEICAKMLRNNYQIIEVPSKYNARIGGISKGTSLKIVYKSMSELWKLCFVLKK